MSAALAALCVVLYTVTAVLCVIADKPIVAVIWVIGALVWVFTFAMEVTR